jgi:hypothetical protein
MLAKKEYQKTTGEIYEDDPSYNARMALFLEWFLLDHYTPGSHHTILENIIEENSSSWTPESLETYKEISNNILALFEVRKVRDHSVVVLDLFADEKYQVEEEDSKLIFRKNDIFQGRIVPHQGKYYFSGNYCFHPNDSQRYIKRETKKIYIIQKFWLKELKAFEKDLSKIQKLSIKNTKSIEKIQTKIDCTILSAKLEYLNSELSALAGKQVQIESQIQKLDGEISQLKFDQMKLEGRRLVSELINKLSYMNLIWERSRQIDISDIYKNNA